MMFCVAFQSVYSTNSVRVILLVFAAFTILHFKGRWILIASMTFFGLGWLGIFLVVCFLVSAFELLEGIQQGVNTCQLRNFETVSFL
jgi:hypothetical protein